MEKANIEGFDYMEYKQSLNSLKNMAMDEQTRFRSAFAMAQTMGATPGNLIEAATHYIKILESEEAKFEQALLKQHSKQIGSKETEIKQLDRLIQEKKKQIEKLNEEIKSHQVVANKMKSQMSTAAGKIETTKNNFIASYNTLVSQIQDDVEKMKQHLK
ncbi:MAG: hypothetical protein GY705_08060 [Bacteroidetes bacterium]|nr:hypothetical protein [Bacteroidota bacterium]